MMEAKNYSVEERKKGGEDANRFSYFVLKFPKGVILWAQEIYAKSGPNHKCDLDVLPIRSLPFESSDNADLKAKTLLRHYACWYLYILCNPDF